MKCATQVDEVGRGGTQVDEVGRGDVCAGWAWVVPLDEMGP